MAICGLGNHGGWGAFHQPYNFLNAPGNSLKIIREIGQVLCGISSCGLLAGAFLGVLNPVSAIIGALALGALGIFLSTRGTAPHVVHNVPIIQQPVIPVVQQPIVHAAPPPPVFVQQPIIHAAPPPPVFIQQPIVQQVPPHSSSGVYQNPFLGMIRGRGPMATSSNHAAVGPSSSHVIHELPSHAPVGRMAPRGPQGQQNHGSPSMIPRAPQSHVAPNMVPRGPQNHASPSMIPRGPQSHGSANMAPRGPQGGGFGNDHAQIGRRR